MLNPQSKEQLIAIANQLAESKDRQDKSVACLLYGIMANVDGGTLDAMLDHFRPYQAAQLQSLLQKMEQAKTNLN